MSDGVVIAIIGGVVAIVVALISMFGLVYSQLRSTHKLINSRMDEMLKFAEAAAAAAGYKAGEQAQRDRASDAQV